MAKRAEWIERLQAEVDRTNQTEAAKRIGYSPAVVCSVLKGTYRGNSDRVKARVEGSLMGVMVDCPVVGEMPRDRCEELQRRKPAATNPLRVQLFIACKSCPNRRD